MGATAHFQTLRELMPLMASSDTTVDWEALARSWGKEFPPDYQQFIELYAAGTIQEYLVVVAPEPKGRPHRNVTGGMRHETANAVDAWAFMAKSPELGGVSPELIAWGASASADILCWDASGDDPERWPVMVCNRDDHLWRRYDVGMAGFLVRIMRGEFYECPLGGLNLWNKEGAKFLNERDYQRLLDEGLDPWTGELDPYAGMFPGN
ncbi:hypothetical protein AB0E01_32240 [Nocardia vinacea]|uniref:hypothetical protein n=1 Tax=Nocardia vinacea TaxID=96468 RepID=UPI0033C410CA